MPKNKGSLRLWQIIVIILIGLCFAKWMKESQGENDVYILAAIMAVLAGYVLWQVIGLKRELLNEWELPYEGLEFVSHDDDRVFKKRLADCVILTHDNKILMQQRPKNWGKYGGALNFFGGHVEDGETIMQALVRELHEELGAVVDPNDVIFLGAVTERETNHTEIIHVHFWHDKTGTITGCYEAESKEYDCIEDAQAHPKIMEYAHWALHEAQRRGLLR